MNFGNLPCWLVLFRGELLAWLFSMLDLFVGVCSVVYFNYLSCKSCELGKCPWLIGLVACMRPSCLLRLNKSSYIYLLSCVLSSNAYQICRCFDFFLIII